MITIKTKIDIPEWLNNIKLEKPMKKTLAQVANNIRTDAVKNAPFKSWTLRRSISVIEKDQGLTMEIWTNLVYASILEYWGEIRPTNWRYLHFKIWNKWIKTRRVQIRARRYMGRAFDMNEPTIKTILVNNIKKYLSNI